MLRAVVTATILGSAVAGCAIADLDVSGRECTDGGACPQGFGCDLSAGQPGRCFRRGGLDAGGDAGAGRRDAGRLELDAGPPRVDAGPPRVDAGPGTGCVNPAHLFCEDFESGTTARWLTRAAGGSSVDITTEYANSGTFAVRATSAAPGETGMIYVPAFEGRVVSDYWVRAHYLLRSGTGTEMTILDVGNALFEQGMVVDVDSYSAASWYSSFNMGNVFDDSVDVNITPDRWFCVEVHVENSADATVEVFFDGASVSSRVGVDVAAAGPLVNVAVGSWSFAPSGVRIVYIDDVVVATERVGCL